MELRPDERIAFHFRRHKTPFVVSVTKMLIASAPFYVLLFFMRSQMPLLAFIIGFLLISLGVGFFLIYTALTYFLDKLVITNHRVLMVNWKGIFAREESEARLSDIQDIRSREKGFLSALRLFDYGPLTIETASSTTSIVFDHAPDPEGIKHKILSHISPSDVQYSGDSARHKEPGRPIPDEGGTVG